MQPIDLGETAPDTAPETVLEFGSGRDDDRPAARRRLAGFGQALLEDHRLIPLSALLAAIAAFGSLISEWQVTTVDASAVVQGEIGQKVLPADLADLGAFGGGYLAGLFLLVSAVVLTLYGPPAGRRYARLAGFSVGGTMLALLASLVSLLGDQSRILSRLFTTGISADQLKVWYGRGIWCALAGVLLAIFALYLSGRHSPTGPAREPADEVAGAEPVTVWSWRRPRTADEESGPNEPFELTVGPAQPFTARLDDHDRPTG